MRAERQAALRRGHAAPLAAFAEKLRARRPGTLVPDADPFDGGTGARILFLLEKPSRLAAETGFVGRDNPARGAHTLGRFLAEARVPRGESLIWNAVPWWNGTAKVTAEERRAGAEALRDLLALLPKLRTAVLVGRVAQTVWTASGGAAVPTYETAHFSANVRAAFPDRWAAIPEIWAEAYSSMIRLAASPKM